MNSRTLLILTGATVAVAGLAALTLRRREAAVRATTESRPLFPELAAALNDTVSVTVKRKDAEYTLQKSGDTWGLAEKKGYPVDLAAVKKTLIGIADLRTVEAKTADPARHAALGLQEPDAEGSTSSLVTIKDASGKELAALIVGKTHEGKGPGAGSQVYVRKAGDPQSWLASGGLELKEKSTEWLDKKILEVKRERTRSVEVKHPGSEPDGDAVLVDREKPEEQNFTLHDIPEGKELTYPTVAGSLASALEWLNLEDVVPAGEVDMKEGIAATARFTCFDGLVITVTTKDVGEKTYARFEASYETPPEPVGPLPPKDAGGEKKEATDDKKDATGEKKDAEADKKDGEKKDEPEKPETKSPEEVKKEVEVLNARLSQWTYVIPSYNKTSFAKRKSELLKDKAPQPEAPKPPGTPTSPVEPPKAEGGEQPVPATPPHEPPH